MRKDRTRRTPKQISDLETSRGDVERGKETGAPCNFTDRTQEDRWTVTAVTSRPKIIQAAIPRGDKGKSALALGQPENF